MLTNSTLANSAFPELIVHVTSPILLKFSLFSAQISGFSADFHRKQGSYTSGKCQGILNFFKIRELSGNFILCQGKMKFCQNVGELSGNFTFQS